MRRRPQLPTVVVAAATVACAAWLARWSMTVDSYVWLIDELLYAKTATFYSEGLHVRPHLFGEPYPVPNALYPAILAPLYALFGSVTAFQLAHAVNAALFASTLVPVYLLARRVLDLPWGYALAAGLGSVLVPWAVAANVLMTESLAYPLSAWALLAMAAALARASWKRDLVALAAIGLAALGRNQLALLAGVLVAAAFLQAVSRATPGAQAQQRLRDRLRPHAALFGVFAGVVLLFVVLRAAGVGVASSYSGVLERDLFPQGLWAASGRHLAHLVVGVGILPAVLFFAWLPRALGWPATRAEQGFALIALIAFAVFAYQVGHFAQNIAGGQYQERYIVYLAPLLALGSVALLADGRPAPRATFALGAAAAAVLIASADPPYPGGESLGAFERIAKAGSAFNEVLEGQVRVWSPRLLGRTVDTMEALVIVAAVAALVAGVLLAPRWRRWSAPALAVLVVAGGAVQFFHLVPRSAQTIDQSYLASLAGVREFDRDWVDKATPGDARVGLMPGFLNGDVIGQWQWHVFWNKRIERLFQLPGRPVPLPFAATETKIDEATGRLLAEPDGTTHLLVAANDATLELRGRTVATAKDGARLLAPDRPWQADWQITGIGGRRQRLLVYPRRGETVLGSVRFVLTAPGDARAPLRVLVTGRGAPVERTIAPGKSIEVTVRLVPSLTGGPATAAFETLNRVLRQTKEPAVVSSAQTRIARG